MRVLVCGGRLFDDASYLNSKLDELNREYGFTFLIEGDALGADRIAGAWADFRGIQHKRFPADWENLGRKAGSIRNKQMLDEGKPDLVIAFPGTSGTFNMCRQAEWQGWLLSWCLLGEIICGELNPRTSREPTGEAVQNLVG